MTFLYVAWILNVLILIPVALLTLFGGEAGTCRERPGTLRSASPAHYRASQPAGSFECNKTVKNVGKQNR